MNEHGGVAIEGANHGFSSDVRPKPGWAIETVGLSRRFGGIEAVSDVSLKVATGSVCGLLGVNGSGKTTLIRMLLGHLRPSAGEVKLLGRSIRVDPVGIRQQVGYVADARYLYDWMSVAEIVRFTSAFHPGWDDQKERLLFGRFALSPAARVGQLSRGHRARLCLVLALAYNPKLIVLDELTAGLDPLVRREVLENIIEEVSQEGRTVFFSSHSVEEVERLADHVAIIHEGRLVVHSTIDEIKSRIFRVRLSPVNDVAQLGAIPGVLSYRASGTEHLLTIGDFDGSAARALSGWGGRASAVPMTLEEIFVEIVRAGGAEPGQGRRR